MKPRTKRSLIVLGGLASLGLATTLVLDAFRSNLVFYFSPSEVAADAVPSGERFRLGGVVAEGSLQREGQTLRVSFGVTDGARTVPVHYEGLLPDMFREGKGVVTQGVMGAGGVFIADQVLAKHDENYMPPEAAQALEDARLAASAGVIEAGVVREGTP